MSTKKYYVVEADQGYTLEDAKECEYTSWGYTHEHALEEWVKHGEGNGWYADGYPEGWKYLIVDCETGEAKDFTVNTEFEPQYFFWEVQK